MRAIALAIFLGLGGIEMAIRKANNIPMDHEDAVATFMGIFCIAFIVCLIGGW